MPPITCSLADKGWSFTLPQIKQADKQAIATLFDTSDEVPDMFVYDPETRTLTLKEELEQELIQGKMCPTFKQQDLPFTFISDILGSSIEIFVVDVIV